MLHQFGIRALVFNPLQIFSLFSQNPRSRSLNLLWKKKIYCSNYRSREQ